MKKHAYLFSVGTILLMNIPALAETRALTINIGSIGGPVDDAAVRSVRQIIGHAVARGAVDTFIVYSPSGAAPIPIEGGLSACAESGFGTTRSDFETFAQDLRTIDPKSGTFYTIERGESCSREQNVACTEDAKLCPDGSAVGRVPPACEFAPCPGE
jgi:hypothetical protein